MAALKTIKNRIASVGKIKKITNALEVVAMTRLRRMESETMASRNYFDKIRGLLFDVTSNINFSSHPFLEGREEVKRVAIVAIFSDKGLCGNFNAAMSGKYREFLSGTEGRDISAVIIGKKGARYIKEKKGHSILKTFSSIDGKNLQSDISGTAKLLAERFLAGKIDELFLIYSKFKLHLLGEVNVIKLLPFTLKGVEPNAERGYPRDYIYEPGAYGIFEGLVNEYIANQIHQGVLESRAAEEMSRMLAMKTASDNADEMIGALNLDYHKSRQAQITKELSEIIGGRS